MVVALLATGGAPATRGLVVAVVAALVSAAAASSVVVDMDAGAGGRRFDGIGGLRCVCVCEGRGCACPVVLFFCFVLAGRRFVPSG